jgi:hypothetical protein
VKQVYAGEVQPYDKPQQGTTMQPTEWLFNLGPMWQRTNRVPKQKDKEQKVDVVIGLSSLPST